MDLEVLLLLAGMMSLAEVASRTGAFDWAAIRCAQLPAATASARSC